jgi:hypothetical protein
MTYAFTITTFGGNCPVQAEGTIDGHAFYFRARGAHWSMSIGGKDVIGEPLWRHFEYWAPWPMAGYMTDDEARECIDRAIDIFRNYPPRWITHPQEITTDGNSPARPGEPNAG